MASNTSPHETFEALLESLQARFPALQHYLPLVLNTRQRLPNIAAEFNVPKDQIARALKIITHCPAYQQALAAPESMRHTLEGIPVRPVSDKHRAFAQAQLDGIPEKDMPRVEKHRTPGPAPIPKIPLTPELLTEILTMAIPGKLDVTLKINELPVVKSLGPTVAFAIQAEGRNVLVELKSKAWNNLKTAAESYPVWVAAISGKMGKGMADGFQLENPAVQVFEKKAKPTEPAAPEPAPLAKPTPEPSAAAPTINAQKPVLKLRKPAT